MRKVTALMVLVAVQAAALAAPLVHAHPDEHATMHHEGRSVHSHWGGHSHSTHHPSDAPSLSADDHDRAVFLNAFVAVAVSHIAIPGVADAVFHLLVPEERAALGGVEVVRSHDPPSIGSLASRAPPRPPVLT